MFIKKDLRKIPRILDEAVECPNELLHEQQHDDSATTSTSTRQTKKPRSTEPLTSLLLGRRPHEFQGRVQILCQPSYVPKLQQLQTLNLYDCQISNLDGMGILGNCPALESLNLGRNPISSIPDEMAALRTSLKELWLDDCQLEGAFPKALLELKRLRFLRLPNNQIKTLPGDLAKRLPHLQVLCLDRNQLTSMPPLEAMAQLRELYARHNQLSDLPASLPASLQILHVSSNPLTTLKGLLLPSTNNTESTDIGRDDASSNSNSNTATESGRSVWCPSLTHLVANGCKLTDLPEGLLEGLPKLERLLINHNQIDRLPDHFWKMVRSEESCQILYLPNPLAETSDNEEEGVMQATE